MKVYRVTNESPLWQILAYNYIRIDSFCVGQKIPVEIEFGSEKFEDPFEGVLVIEDHKPVAGLRIAYPKPGVGKIERVCTVRELQKSGYGRVMIEEAEKWIAEKGVSHIVISSQDRALGFYEKCGYVQNPDVSPEEYDTHHEESTEEQVQLEEVEFKPDFTCVLVEKFL